MQKLNKIREAIEAADSIAIFRHQYPDMDAAGSQLGLKQALLDLYPNKKVYAIGTMDFHESTMDIVSDDVLSHSLAILLDTANEARIDDQRFKLCRFSIRFDHHVPVETIADIEWVDEKASATCELLALYFKSMNQKISSEAAQLLYKGLTADNIRFTIGTVRKESFLAAAYLIEQGIDVVQAEIDNFSSSLLDYQYETKVRSKAIVKEKSMTSIMQCEDYQSSHLSFKEAKEKVYALSGVREIEVWALFTETEEGVYNASLRSKTKSIREIAVQYGGGGHNCASGIKGLSLDDVQEIIEKLKVRSIQE